MAADKEIMRQIEALRLDRPGRVYRAATEDDELGDKLREAFGMLALTYREEAELWTKSGARGWKSSETEAYLIAQAVDGVAAQLDSAGGDTGPRTRNRQCDDPQPHERHENGVGEVTGDTLYCLGVRPAADLSGLDQLIADSAAEGRGQLRNEAAALGLTLDVTATAATGEPVLVPRVTIDVPGIGESDVAAYLSGGVDTLPGLREALVPGSVRTPDADAAMFGSIDKAANEITIGDPPITAAEVALLDAVGVDTSEIDMTSTGPMILHTPDVPPTWENDVTSPDGHRLPGNVPAAVPPVPLLGQPGDAGAGYDPKYIPPGGAPFTFAELMTPVPYAALPPHLSNSQMNTVGECPAKYRMQRLARNTDPRATPEMNPQIPQWANIGGTAFHSAVESIERRVITGLADGSAADLTTWNVEQCWEHAFGQAIAEVESTSPVPRALWRASKRGAEGETWWNANGPEMLKRYLAARPAEPTMVGASGTPCIEADLTVQVQTGTGYGTLPFNAILDRVTVTDNNKLTIRDYKSGDKMPDTNAQLAEQAWTLALHSGFTADQIVPGRVYGTFFNARKGTWTPPVDLFAEYSWDWFVYRLVSAHAQKLALTTGPTPARVTSFCGGCSVKWACPAGGPKR